MFIPKKKVQSIVLYYCIFPTASCSAPLVENHHCMIFIETTFSLFFLDIPSEVTKKVYLSYWHNVFH
jgi:hypothetical protein